jgi:predicted DNA-binding transcriptional regulator YafY
MLTGMSRTHRLFDLLQMLRGRRRPVSGAELAREAGVSLRTLYRDILALQALGAGIDGEAGVGYVLKPGFLLPPLMLSLQEIEALTLGLQWVARRTDAELAVAARNAMAKVSAVLPADLRAKMDDDVLLIAPVKALPQAVPLALLRRAVGEERKLAISYADERNSRTRRLVWPVTVGFFDTTRILVAWCELRQDFRHFRTDRIEAADMLAERLPRPRRTLMKEWRLTLAQKSTQTADKI